MNDKSVTEQDKQTFSKEESEYFRRLSEEKYEIDLQVRLLDAIESGEMSPLTAACNAVFKGMSVTWIHTITKVDPDIIRMLALAFKEGVERGKIAVQLDALGFISNGGTQEQLKKRLNDGFNEIMAPLFK
jgi:hypothetical protein